MTEVLQHQNAIKCWSAIKELHPKEFDQILGDVNLKKQEVCRSDVANLSLDGGCNERTCFKCNTIKSHFKVNHKIGMWATLLNICGGAISTFILNCDIPKDVDFHEGRVRWQELLNRWVEKEYSNDDFGFYHEPWVSSDKVRCERFLVYCVEDSKRSHRDYLLGLKEFLYELDGREKRGFVDTWISELDTYHSVSDIKIDDYTLPTTTLKERYRMTHRRFRMNLRQRELCLK